MTDPYGPMASTIPRPTGNTRSLPATDGTTIVHCPPDDVLLSHCRQTIPHAGASPPGPDRFGTMEIVGHSSLVDGVAALVANCQVQQLVSPHGRRILTFPVWAPALEVNK